MTSVEHWREAWIQFKFALPVAGANLLQRAAVWVTWICVGHLGEEIMGPVTLSSSVNNVLGVSVVGGLSMGIATLASQAHGARNDEALSLVLQRAILVGLLGSLPCVALLLVMRPLLLALHMTEDFANVAGRYAFCVLLVTPCMGVQRSIGMWLVSQKINMPRLVAIVVALPLHAAMTVAATAFSNFRYEGAGVAMTLSTALQAGLLYCYISCSSACAASWKGFTRQGLKDWGPYLEVAIPGVLMNTEYFVGESLVFAASLLPDPDTCLSALSIYQLTQTTCYQIPSGIRMAISARVGNQLGAEEPLQAAVSSRAGLRLILIWICLPSVALLVFTRQWGLMFTTDEDVLKLLSTLVWLMLLYSSLDAILAYYNGVLSACGQQSISGKWAIRGYVFVSFPLAMLFAFGFKWRVHGLCAAHCIGKIVHTIPCMVAVWQIDWNKESARAVNRVERVAAASTVPLVRTSSDATRMIANNSATGAAMVEAHGVEAVLSAMRLDLSKADLQSAACKILCSVAMCDAKCQEKVAKSGAAQAVLDAMRAHSSVAAVQELGCQALKEFAAYNAESQEDIYMRGGIQVVLRAMEANPHVPNLQVMGCGVLRNLAACNSEQQQAVVSRGGIQVVLDAMSMHSDSSAMQWAGCWTMFCLCVHNAEMRCEVAAYGAARVALKALEAHRAEHRVQEAGCWLLKVDTSWLALSLRAVLGLFEESVSGLLALLRSLLFKSSMRLFSLVVLAAVAPTAGAASARKTRCDECAQLAKRVEQLEALLSTKADALEMLSTAQVRDGLKKLADGSLLESVANVSNTLQSLPVACNASNASSGARQEYLVELPSLSSVLWLIAVGFSMMMAFLSLCIVLGESKVNHERLQALESRAVTGQEQQPQQQPKAICDLRLLALEDIKEEEPKLRTKVLSGAVGAAIGSTTGAISGTAVGGTVGAAIGLVPAVFTFGLSIPVGAFIGSSLGFASGGVVGGSAG
ncbi:slc47a1, partial [Symbiodinium sp. KB8]